MWGGFHGPSRQGSRPKDNRGVAGIGIALALAFIMVLSAVAVTSAVPASSDATSAEPVERTETVEGDLQVSFHDANRRSVELTDWDGSTSASGFDPSGPPVRRFIDDSAWNEFDAQTRQAVQTETGAFVESIKTQYASTAESVTIEPTMSGYQTGTRISYLGWLNQTGSNYKFAGPMSDTRDLIMRVNRDSLADDQSDALEVVFREDSGPGIFRVQIWQDGDKIRINSSEGLSRSVSSNTTTIDFTEGTIEGTDAPLDYESNVGDTYELWLQNGDEGLGVIELFAAGSPDTDVYSQTGGSSGDTDNPWVRVKPGLIYDANLEVTYRADGTTYTDQIHFAAERTNTRACDVPGGPDELPCDDLGDYYEETPGGPGDPGGPSDPDNSDPSASTGDPVTNSPCAPDCGGSGGWSPDPFSEWWTASETDLANGDKFNTGDGWVKITDFNGDGKFVTKGLEWDADTAQSMNDGAYVKIKMEDFKKEVYEDGPCSAPGGLPNTCGDAENKEQIGAGNPSENDLPKCIDPTEICDNEDQQNNNDGQNNEGGSDPSDNFDPNEDVDLGGPVDPDDIPGAGSGGGNSGDSDSGASDNNSNDTSEDNNDNSDEEDEDEDRVPDDVEIPDGPADVPGVNPW